MADVCVARDPPDAFDVVPVQRRVFMHPAEVVERIRIELSAEHLDPLADRVFGGPMHDRRPVKAERSVLALLSGCAGSFCWSRDSLGNAVVHITSVSQ